MSGHFVQGHVDTTTQVKKISPYGKTRLINFKLLDSIAGNDKTSVELLTFLNCLLSFFIFIEFVNRIVKVIFFSLKKGTIFEIFFNFFLK